MSARSDVVKSAFQQPQNPPPATPSIPSPPKLLSPATATPKAPSLTPPAKPSASGGFDAAGWLGNPIGKGLNALGSTNQYDMTSKLTSNAPPLLAATKHLPQSWQGPANTALSYVQKQMNNPGGADMFGGILGAAAPGVTEGILSAGPAGLAAMTGLQGALKGGDSFAATKTLFNPLLNKL